MGHNSSRDEVRKQRHRLQAVLYAALAVFVIILLAGALHLLHGDEKIQALAKARVKVVEDAPDYDVQLLTINEYSRPGKPIDKITGIVVHYTANPETTAKQNRDYFEGLKDSHETSASSHFIIGIDGELIQCIPCNEISYASNERNHDTISIECCIPDDTGKFTDETYQTLVHLSAWLCGRYDLDTEDIIRHYDVTGKICPKYFVEHEDAWEQFKEDVEQYIEDYGVIPQENT